MKLIFEPGEKESLRKIYDEHPDFGVFNGLDPNREYGIKFTVTDPAVASYILCGMLHDRIKDDIDIGIKVNEINMSPIPSVYDLKSKLHAMIDEII